MFYAYKYKGPVHSIRSLHPLTRSSPLLSLNSTQRLKGRPFSLSLPSSRSNIFSATYTPCTSTSSTYNFLFNMSSNTSSRASSPGSPDRSRSNKENEPMSAPSTPPSSPSGKKSKKSRKGLTYGGISKSSRKSLGLGRSPSAARILSGGINSNARRVTLAGTSLFAEAAYSEAAAELEVENIFFNALAKELTESPLADVSGAFQTVLFSPSAS